MATTNVTRTGEERGHGAQERQGAQEKMTGMAEKVTDRAKEAASAVGQSASNIASAAAQKADDATATVGSGMRSMAETVRHRGPRSGILGTTSSSVADALERGGEYLEEEGLSGIAEDITSLIRRNPVPSLLVGIGIGFLLARAASRS